MNRTRAPYPSPSPAPSRIGANTLTLRHLGIDTYGEAVIYMRSECPVCRSVGLSAQSRVRVTLGDRSLVATLNMVTGPLLGEHEAGLSEVAWRALDAKPGDVVAISNPPPVSSLGHVRAKAYGHALGDQAFHDIIREVVSGLYSDIQISAFLTACVGDHMSFAEVAALTRAMVDVGEQVDWARGDIFDKHCVGGLPGNRTTLIVVPIIAAAGLTIPKTSSRAITSPAGTADTMEMLAPVELDRAAMRRVVDREGGCIIWGGAARLSPADDVLIRVERPLNLDSEGQLVASILSKKKAAGSTHVVIDMPVGPTAKLRTAEAAQRLRALLEGVGEAMGLRVRVLETDGLQPVGRGIGPALEARDVLAVLQGSPDAPQDLRERASMLAGAVLEMAMLAAAGQGAALASSILADGRAAHKFEALCSAQGGRRTPPTARHSQPVTAMRSGIVTAIDNRRLARVAKLAGAPQSPAAGVDYLAPLGKRVERGEPLYVVCAQQPGELGYALEYLNGQPNIVEISDLP
ncbi:MAG: thymidine phosphorylase family protein [Betaproteobacteria bacterium]